jgi:hypothetical protein
VASALIVDMNVRQHTCVRGECLGAEASGFSPMRFFPVGGKFIYIRAVVWQKTETICAELTRY